MIKIKLRFNLKVKLDDFNDKDGNLVVLLS